MRQKPAPALNYPDAQSRIAGVVFPRPRRTYYVQHIGAVAGDTKLAHSLTRNSNAGRTANHDLSAQTMHRPATVHRELVAELQIMDEQLAGGQLVELSICKSSQTYYLVGDV